ncbi:MAG: sulfite exporter TauE/SafE family protein [Gammaproteobacteria bacterium]|nr:sulfite exporter TauE/SafE family protein [Gammaproteobacteria bacterium]
MSIALVSICLIVGVLIGAIGIGGVLLVPALTLIAGIGVHEAVPVCTLSFLATGVIGVIVYARHGSIQWPKVIWLCLGAVPAAFLGSVSLLSIPAVAVMLLIAMLMIVSGVDALIKTYRKPARKQTSRQLSPAQYIVIGAITGFGSAITGTGGPLILVPIIIFLGLPVLTAIGLSQAIQLPIAAFASVGNWLSGNLNFDLVLVIATVLVIGAFGGALLVHRLPTEPIRKLIAVLLVFFGTAIGIQQLLNL